MVAGTTSRRGATEAPRRARRHLSDSPWPWLAPLIVLLAAFALFPLLYNVCLSFHEFVPRERALEYVGLANWRTLMGDERMWDALWVTLRYTGICLVIELALGMGIALLLDSDDPGFGVLRGLLTLTLVIPPAITGMMFLLMQDAQFGLIPFVLRAIGAMDATGTILSDPALALWGVMLADIWQWTPFMVLIFVAGLRALPADPFESAMIDGAGPIQIFWRLTLPMMSKVIAIAGPDPGHRSVPGLRLRLRDDLGRAGDRDLHALALRLAADVQLHQVGLRRLDQPPGARDRAGGRERLRRRDAAAVVGRAL